VDMVDCTVSGPSGTIETGRQRRAVSTRPKNQIMQVAHRRVLLLATALVALSQFATAGGPRGGVLALTGADPDITLVGPDASARVLIEERLGGSVRDVSDAVMLTVADPNVARVADGTVRALHDGSTTLTARWTGQVLQVPVRVRGVGGAKPPRFATEVIPVLTRAGCNQGSCHGAASGKGGFKLSLQGYDPDADYEAITRAAGARRISPAQPENSLILRKPTMAVPHRGGKVIEVGSPAYRLLVDWIAGRMPAPQPTDPGVAALEVVPPVRTLPVGQKQRFRVWARFTDGTRRDVSPETLFSGNDGTVARVTPDGEATVVGKGEAAVLVRYRDRVATASVISPFSAPHRAAATGTGIDRLVDRKLAALFRCRLFASRLARHRRDAADAVRGARFPHRPGPEQAGEAR